MISDEPDEDADSLDDDALIEAFTRPVVSRAATAGAVPAPADWPGRADGRQGLTIDAEILAWFQAHHPDWQRRIAAVLRGWIASRPGPDSRHPG